MKNRCSNKSNIKSFVFKMISYYAPHIQNTNVEVKTIHERKKNTNGNDRATSVFNNGNSKGTIKLYT